jgi:adenylate cyclase
MGKRTSHLWRELRRRRVVTTSAGYAATAFVLLQLAEILFPAFGVGEGGLRVLLAVLLAGFPLTVALSWVFDVTRSGVRVTPPAEGEGDVRVPAPRPVVIGSVLLMAAGLAWGGWWVVRAADPADATPEGIRSIAVLPFKDLSEAGDQTYLGDGLAEEILNRLAGVDSLQVAARTSSFAFRDRNRDVRDIGRQLNVAAVLEGSLRRSGNHVRITAQLIDARTGFHLWSQDFDREVDNLFAVQDTVAGAIVRELTGHLALPGRTARRPVPPAAQEAYWQARAQLSRRDASVIPQAISLFQQAVSIDPDYAAAYAGLADSYALMPVLMQSMAPGEALAQAEQWARKAIELDSTLADPWASLGLVHALHQDRVEALDAFARALRLNPSYAPALHWRANVLADMGQLVPARRDAEKAARLDPLSASVATDHAAILFWSGDVEAAGVEVERALDRDFSYRPAIFLDALLALEQERELPLRMSLTQWAVLCGLPSDAVPHLAEAMLAYRRTGEAASPPPELRGLEPRPGVLSSGTLAALYALVGDREQMITWLRRAVEDGSWAEEYLAVNPIYEPFRGDPEFREIVAELG